MPDRGFFVPFDSRHITRAGIKNGQFEPPCQGHSLLAQPRRGRQPSISRLGEPRWVGKQHSKGLCDTYRLSGKEEMGEK